MAEQPDLSFQWLSPLGISVILFLLYGGLHLLIGFGIAFWHNVGAARELLIVSPRTDAIVFGQPPTRLLQDDVPLARLRTILFQIMGGPYMAVGCLVLAVSWFGLRQGQPWALVALALGGIAIVPFYLLSLRPYFQPGVDLTLFDVPPFMWIPVLLLLPAVVSGWIGLA